MKIAPCWVGYCNRYQKFGREKSEGATELPRPRLFASSEFSMR